MADRETIIRGLDYWARNSDNPAIRVDCAAARDFIVKGEGVPQCGVCSKFGHTSDEHASNDAAKGGE